MDVTHARFPYEVLRIMNEVADCHFVAFDLEFSGVAQQRRPGASKLTLQEYYEDVKSAAKKYQVLQVGLTIVSEDIQNCRYVARPYNFNLSPLTFLPERHFSREWSCHSGAISFLSRNGFKFDKPITEGVQYLSRKEEQEARKAMIDEDDLSKKSGDIVPKGEDEALINHVRSSINNWLAEPDVQRQSFHNIPGEADGVPSSLNRYQMRLTHQIVQNEYPDLKRDSMKFFIRLTKATDEKKAAEILVKTQFRETKIADAVGFRWLMEAIFAGNISGMPNSYLRNGMLNVPAGVTQQDFLHQLQEKLRTKRRILVGHNCFTDLVNLYKCFIGDLPSSVDVFADEIHSLLPGVLDTKYIASHGTKKWRYTSLDEVEADIRSELLPKIEIPAEFDRYEFMSSYHEAGYDSFLTARVAIKLTAKMERDGTYANAHAQLNEGTGDAPIDPDFGVDEEGYVTATESLHSQASHGLLDTDISPTGLLSPLKAIKALFKKQEIAPQAGTSLLEEDSELTPTMAKPMSLVAVKEREHTTKWSDKVEVSRIRDKLAKTNIYETLELDESGPEQESGEDDLMTFSDDSKPGSPVSGSRLESLVKKGEVMPRWDGPNGFWRIFGNKLQANATQEGVCRLND